MLPHPTRGGGVAVSAGRSPEELLAAATAGDSAAWAELVDRYGARLWHVARAHGLSAQDAADVVQFGWLKLVENLYAIREPAAVGAWLTSTVKHEAMRVRRKRSGEHLHADPPDELLDPTGRTEEDPADAVLGLDEGERLWRAVAQLGEPCRSLLRLLVTDPDAGYRLHAVRLGMPVGSIGPTRRRCLDRLRALIAAEEEPA
ncbi:RNA polymerase sigma factor, sigma-70 family [Sinosporangium album]|uniref:RNA polymerase sigma factor, sigma-70 family n=1 Tax=Sinosporangium album TaxID=504805 RepID=A0A1G7TF34_9ACTN|nr:sigma-70 family RNA polymerase sigma factor [Sinosporangium album]SDG33644.1 RNA polymerase sigma factor, sigma-70 family [Sinosporangium album]